MRVKVKLPEGARIDRDRLVSAIRAALTPDDPTIWHLNDVPAIAQLEESLYEQGTQDIAAAWEQTAKLLGLPADGLNKAVGARLDLGSSGSLKDRVKEAFFGQQE